MWFISDHANYAKATILYNLTYQLSIWLAWNPLMFELRNLAASLHKSVESLYGTMHMCEYALNCIQFRPWSIPYLVHSGWLTVRLKDMHSRCHVCLHKCMQSPDCSASIGAASGSSWREATYTLHEMELQPIVVKQQAQPAMPKPEQDRLHVHHGMCLQYGLSLLPGSEICAAWMADFCISPAGSMCW